MVHSPVTPGPAELADELRRAGVPEVDTVTRRRAEYSSDASNYRVVPRVVVFPRHADEIEAALSVCARLGVPLVPRGGGTSIAGNALSSGVVLDLSRHLNRVIGVDPAARTAEVEPGAVLDDITAAGAPHGLRFGPDPSTHARASIGGSIGNNACGARALRYGRTADNVVALEVITGTGVRFTARRYGRDARRPPGRRPGCCPPCGEVVGERLAMVRTEFGRFPRQVSGYSLEHLLPENGTDVAKFLAGTEGTLALTLRATVRLVEAPRATAMAVLGYGDMAEAAEAVPGILGYAPVALEGLDSRMVDVVRSRRGAAAVPDLPRGGGWLFIETAGGTLAEAEDAAAKLAGGTDCLDSAVVSGARAAALWRIREDGAGLERTHPGGRSRLARLGGLGRPRRTGCPRTCANCKRLWRSTDSTGCCTGTSATAACTCASTSRCEHVRGCCGSSPRRRRNWPPRTAARPPASTATGALAANSCGTCTPPPLSTRSARSSEPSTPAACSTPA